jgi:hypothetical protein
MQSVGSDTQTAEIGTEHTLDTETDPGVYSLVVDMANLAAGDIVVLRIKTKCAPGETSRVAYQAIFAGVQSEPNKYSVPVPIDTEIVCTLQQTAGTGRDFPWNLLFM